MAGYLGNVPVPQATQTRDRFVATSGQTTFATSGYTVGYLDVYLNGVKLDSTDYTATNGSDVVLNSGATADDIVDVVAFSTFEIGSNVDNATVATQSLTVDRQSTDGTIIDLRKDGTIVGSIGVDYGNRLYIGSGDTGLFFNPDVEAIQPHDPSSSVVRDAAISLGTSASRYKDLYLSGGVYLGGTGSANYLDDYEEGGWTPYLFGSSTTGSPTYQDASGYYTKVGRLVTIGVRISLSNKGGMAGEIKLGGLPFTPSSSVQDREAGLLRHLRHSVSETYNVFALNSQTVLIFRSANTSADNTISDGEIADNYFIHFGLTYRTNA